MADDLLKAVPEEIGYFMDDCKINAMAYADDINIITASSVGMQGHKELLKRKAKREA